MTDRNMRHPPLSQRATCMLDSTRIFSNEPVAPEHEPGTQEGKEQLRGRPHRPSRSPRPQFPVLPQRKRVEKHVDERVRLPHQAPAEPSCWHRLINP